MGQELRVNFKNAPGVVLKQIFGEAKHAAIILESLGKFSGQAHEKEIFHYLNTDDDGDWVITNNSKGEPSVVVPMPNLRKQLSTMVDTGQIKRLGERSARYALPTFEGQVDDEGEDEAEEGTEE